MSTQPIPPNHLRGASAAEIREGRARLARMAIKVVPPVQHDEVEPLRRAV